MKYFIKKSNVKFLLFFAIALGLVCIMVEIFMNSYASMEPIERISFTSQVLDYSKGEPGSIQVNHGAKWISSNQASIRFDVHTTQKMNDQSRDVILVLDISSSMEGNDLDHVKQDTVYLLDSLLSNMDNQVSLITFSSTSEIVSEFTNNKETLTEKINSLTVSEDTNYYQALTNVDILLSNYQKETDRDCFVLFLTDGYPSEDVSEGVEKYKDLKSKYSYLTIHAIQYEMGDTILDPVKEISDRQFVANQNSLQDILLDASKVAVSYKKFILTNIIDSEYFEIESTSHIHPSLGSVELVEENGKQKILWMVENLPSGKNLTLTIDTNLKKDYRNQDEFFPTNQETIITYKIGEVEENLTNRQTPILQSYYQVHYDANAPTDCTIGNVSASTRKMVYDLVDISDSKPSCDGYQFLGWKIVTEDTNQMNDDYFRMPEHDVVLRAEWGKLTLSKTMDGKVYVAPPKNTKTAQEAVDEMKIGWNLGNTLDSHNYQKSYLGEDKAISYYETLWNNPETTKEMIDEIKKAGFNSVRVPVTYYDHIDSSGKIDSKWMERVKEVVGYVLDNDMYCILNIHHDTGFYEGGAWIVADADKFQENADNLEKLWTQIATEFKDYDYKLVFEGFNEILDSERHTNWKEGNEDTLNVNKLSQVFVDTVRKTGGKNEDRFLVVTTYSSATYLHLLQSFVMPEDSADHKIILSLHNYSATESDIDQLMGNLKTYCTDKGIPVILDEFGTKAEDLEEDRRVEIASYYVTSAKELGITCFWWDNGKEVGYQLFDRRNLTWIYPNIKDALINNS